MRVTKYSCSMCKDVNHHDDFWRLQYLRSLALSTWNDSFSSRRKPRSSRFPVNRLGFPGIFSSPLFALYASCSFMFLGTNIAHHSAPYFLRRPYFCLLPASRSSRRGLHIRRKVVPGLSQINYNRIFVTRPSYFHEKKKTKNNNVTDVLFIHCQLNL